VSDYFRLIFFCVRSVALAVFILDILMICTNVADCSLQLNWGWDCHLPFVPLWIAIAAVFVFGITTLAKRVIKKSLCP
jgi:hypothetical protein